MKKYIAPEVEIKRFSVEDIMSDSSVTATLTTDTDALNATTKDTVTYTQLFGL